MILIFGILSCFENKNIIESNSHFPTGKSRFARQAMLAFKGDLYLPCEAIKVYKQFKANIYVCRTK